MRIKILDSNLANQIAAGEVVERPASVIKELFENSIDAEATQIVIDVKKGGHELIRIMDNGCGIHSQDLWLAIRRHSTSKIGTLEDLTAIQTLGFRGEALASVAAVSRFKLISRQADSDAGFYIHTEGEHAEETVSPIAHPIGTTVEVRDLFFNTPARRKFLRTPQTEFCQIESMLQRLALGNFSLGIKLTHNQKTIYDLPRSETDILKEQRVEKFLGKAFMENALAIEFSTANMRLWGWIALPTFSRSQPDMQHFYLNNRLVRDKTLNHAVRNAYQDILYHGRHPAFILYFECDPRSVDVNVHPTKQEVRLHDNRLVHDFIVRGVKDALAQVKPVSSVIPPVFVPAALRVQESSPPVYLAEKSIEKPFQKTIFETESPINTETKAHKHHPKFSLGFAIAQLHNIYILAETDAGLVIVDMHAAHERILYEKIKQQMTLEEIQRQALLIPINVALTPQEIRTWEEHHNFFDRIGLITMPSGPSSIMIREIPSLLKGADVGTLIKDALADFSEYDSSQRIEDHLHSILGNMACHSAIKSGHSLNIPEMNTLLRDMEGTPNSGFCNHGRPTWVPWSLKELDSFFLRGQ